MITMACLVEIKGICTIPFSFLVVKTVISKAAPSTRRNIEPDDNTWPFNAFKR